jgi:hypothetical protein
MKFYEPNYVNQPNSDKSGKEPGYLNSSNKKESVHLEDLPAVDKTTVCNFCGDRIFEFYKVDHE